MKFPKGTILPSGGEAFAGSEPTGSQDRKNRCTMMSFAGGFERLASPISPKATLEAIYPYLLASSGHDAGAVLVAAVDHRGQVLGASILAPGESVTLGRHTQCRIRLPSEGISLRHLSIHVGGRVSAPLVRVWDLRTERLFTPEDGVAAAAVTSEGPFFASLSSYSIAALPLALPQQMPWPETAAAAWELLPEREFVSRLAEGSHGDQSLPKREAPKSARGKRITLITRVSPVVHLGEAASAHPDLAVAELELRYQGTTRRFLVGPSSLERGLLVGRYDRCGGRIMGDEMVSRVHLLLASSGLDTWVIDTASTHGIQTRAGEIENRPLGAEEVFLIGEETLVVWKAKKAADA